MQLAREELEQAYRQMKTIRDFEDHLHREIAKGTIGGFTHLYGGQEAIAVGVCENLKDTDYITSTHRGHGHCIAKGCDVKGMMKELYGRADGLCKGKGGSMHVADMDVGMLGANGIVGGGPPLATGAALAAKLDGNGGVALSFGGDNIEIKLTGDYFDNTLKSAREFSKSNSAIFLRPFDSLAVIEGQETVINEILIKSNIFNLLKTQGNFQNPCA